MTEPTLRVLSLGAGVQSTAVLLMAHEGEIDVDVAIFADTGWEPEAVYKHLEWLETFSRVPILRVGRGNLRTDALDPSHRFASLPLYVDNGAGEKEGALRRQCTREYKIEPIQKATRWLLGLAPRQRVPKGTRVEMVKGISWDETQRMRTSALPWIEHVYPLIDRRMTRTDCVTWLERHGYPRPPRSACIGCPFHHDREWRAIRENPEEWADAVEFDHKVRATFTGKASLGGKVFLHRSLQPLDLVDLDTLEDKGQGTLDGFGAVCDDGACGV